MSGVLVLQDGQVTIARHAGLGSPTMRRNTFSGAKFITSTQVGAAMKDGYTRPLLAGTRVAATWTS